MIVAFLQNQWFENPERMQQISKRMDHEKFVKMFLFYRCRTGKILKAAFGDLIDHIVWENQSPLIGDCSSSRFPPDFEHIQRVLDKYQPELVLAFGALAANALSSIEGPWTLHTAPHPVASVKGVKDRLHELAQICKLYVGKCPMKCSE